MLEYLELLFIGLMVFSSLWIAGYIASRDNGFVLSSFAIFNVVLGLCFLMVLIVFGIRFQKTETQIGWQESKVISLAKSMPQLSGSFILGSGNIAETEYYYANTINNKGAIERKYIPVEKTTRYIDENLTDTARYLKPICMHDSNWLFHASKDDTFVCLEVKRKLYVPKNTIYSTLKEGGFQ